MHIFVIMLIPYSVYFSITQIHVFIKFTHNLGEYEIFIIIKNYRARAIDYMAESFQLPSRIKGYHVYKDLWNPSLRDQLHSQSKRSNDKGRYAVDR